MPCDSSYMDPTRMEQNLSQVACLLDEINGGDPADRTSHDWNGNHPAVYNRGLGRATLDQWVSVLCSKLEARGGAADLSLEMQIWWRDHQRADEWRERQEKEAIENEIERLKESVQKGKARLKGLGAGEEGE